MYDDTVILVSSLFGSVYLMSKSLDLLNKQLLYTKPKDTFDLSIYTNLFGLNGLIFLTSGSIFIYSVIKCKNY